MTAKLIMGTEIRETILEELAAEVKAIKAKHGVVPGLVTILVGENPASVSYVTLKIKTAHRLGYKEIQDNQPADGQPPSATAATMRAADTMAARATPQRVVARLL